MGHMARLAAWIGVTLSLLIVSPVAAQSSLDRFKARKLAGAAMDLYDAKDYEAALEKFLEADKLIPTTTLKLRAARCLDRLDRLKEAVDKYREVIDTELKRWAPRPHQEAREDAKKELAALQEQIPTLAVVVAGPGSERARVQIDGKAMGDKELAEDTPLDPGVYTLEAYRGPRKVKKTVRLKRGDKLRITLELPAPEIEKPPPKDEVPWRIAGFVAVGVGAVGLVMGSVAGALVLGDEAGLAARCRDRKCPPEAHDDAKTFEMRRTLSTVGFVVGAVAAAGGAALLLLAPPESDSAALRPFVTPLGAGLQGSF